MKIFCSPPADKCNLSFKKLAAFTLAEILLSLTVIGIVAAIALPSLLGNANERAWETQKKALYTRFSQALPLLPSLNGYGELKEEENGDITDTAAETFVRDGLSKVMKITNICDNDHLTDCGLPDKIIPISGSANLSLSNIKTLSGFNPIMTSVSTQDPGSSSITYTYNQTDTKAAAFETVNGESILVYYNPNCQPYIEEASPSWYYTQPKMCANFVYDLNGKKGPNTVGKDIGFITAMYSTSSIVVAPNPYPNELTGIKQEDAGAKCKELDSEAKVPNLDESASLFYNAVLINAPLGQNISYWTNTSYAYDTEKAWYQSFLIGRYGLAKKTAATKVRCIKK